MRAAPTLTPMPDLPAILGGTPRFRALDWPTWPQWDDTERTRLLAVLDEGGWWTGDGGEAQQFADNFARYQSATHGLPFTNGTHTIEAALVACDIGEGDEVIVPGLTFVATAGAVLAVNAVPVLVDVDPGSLNLDLDAAEAAITHRTRAIVAVHIAGNACDLDALVALCERRGLHLIEDCAHAHGTFWRDRGVGSFGAFGSFSMQRSKLMTAGEGGVLISNDPDRMQRAWSYWNCGRVPGEHWYHHPTYGSNLRMTEWQGAILNAQLERFPEQNARRNASAIALNQAIARVPGLSPQTRDQRMNTQGNYCYVFHFDREAFAGMSLVDFERALAAEGVPLGVSYPALNTLALFRSNSFAPRFRTAPLDYRDVRLPIAERAATSTVWMEHRVLLADPERVATIADACERIQRHAARIVRT